MKGRFISGRARGWGPHQLNERKNTKRGKKRRNSLKKTVSEKV